MLTDERIEEIQINYLEYGQEVAGLDFARAIEAEVRAEAHYLKRELDISDGTVELLEKQNKELQVMVANLEKVAVAYDEQVELHNLTLDKVMQQEQYINELLLYI